MLLATSRSSPAIRTHITRPVPQCNITAVTTSRRIGTCAHQLLFIGHAFGEGAGGVVLVLAVAVAGGAYAHYRFGGRQLYFLERTRLRGGHRRRGRWGHADSGELTLSRGGLGQLVGVLYMHQVVAVEVLVGEDAEDIVEHRGGRLDVRMVHDAAGLEAGEDKLVDIFLQGHAVLQAYRHRDGEGVHQAPHGGAFLGHIDKDFTNGTVAILAGAEEQRLSAYFSFKGVTTALGG